MSQWSLQVCCSFVTSLTGGDATTPEAVEETNNQSEQSWRRSWMDENIPVDVYRSMAMRQFIIYYLFIYDLFPYG